MNTGVIMARPRKEESYFFTKDKRGKDSYILSIRDDHYAYGFKRIIFHASRNDAGIIARELYDNYMRTLAMTPEQKEKLSEVPVTVAQACEIFIKRRETGRSETCQVHSIEQVSARFRNHLIPYLGKKRLSSLVVEDVTAYKLNLQKKGLSDRSVHYCIDEAKEFFNYCVEVGWMLRTPFDSTFKMARPKPRKNRIPGNIQDYRKMLLKGWKNPINHAVAMVCFFTGMRVSEIRALKKNDFETYYGHEGIEDCVVLHIRHSLTNRNVEKSPKNGRERLTVLPRWVYEFIQPVFLLSNTDLCFSNTQGKKPISIDKNLEHFRNELAEVMGTSPEAVQAAGIDFHSLRKMFNSMMTGTLSSDIRRGILGWTSENVALEHYFQVLPIHYQKILDAQKVLFDEESVAWFKSHDILDLAQKYKKPSRAMRRCSV